MQELLLAYGDISFSDDEDTISDRTSNATSGKSDSNVMTVQGSISLIMSAIDSCINVNDGYNNITIWLIDNKNETCQRQMW